MAFYNNQADDELMPFEWLAICLFDRIDETITYLRNEKFPSRDDRTKKIFQLLTEEVIVLPSTNIPSKCQSKSTEFRNKGNEYFRSNELDNACETYTKSIAWATPGSKELSMAYANRSAVLLKANFMADCLEDIDRSLANNYPDNLKSKLYLRKAACLQALCPDNSSAIEAAFSDVNKWLNKMNEKNLVHMQKMVAEQANVQKTEPIICHKLQDIDQGPPPILQNENPKIPGLSDAVELTYSEKWGRHCIAARDIRPGELLGVQKSYVKIVDERVMDNFCWHCGQQTWSGIPCSGCPVVIYCSNKCRDNAQTMYHDFECRVIQEFRDYGIPHSFLVALKLTIMAYKEAGCSLEQLKRNVEQLNSIKERENQGFTDGVMRPDKFASTQGLLSSPSPRLNHEGLRTERLSIGVGIMSGFFLAKKMNLIDEKCEKMDTSLINDDLKFLVSFIEGNVCRTNVNIYETEVPLRKDDVIATGYNLIPAFSFFNLSCIPMIAKSRYEDYFVLRSVCPIEKGQQIFISNYIYYTVSKKERQDDMLGYNFVCDCEACVDNWPVLNVDKIAIDNILKYKRGLERRIHKYWDKIEEMTQNMSNYALKNKKLMDITEDINEGIEILERAHDSLGKKSSLLAIATIWFEAAVQCGEIPFITLN